MRENPDGFPSSAGRFATGTRPSSRFGRATDRVQGPALPFRYTVVTCLSSHSMRCLGDGGNKVAAGINPAANATLGTTGLLPFRYAVVTCPSSHSMRRFGDGGNKLAAGINPAASATLDTAGSSVESRPWIRPASALSSRSPGPTSAPCPKTRSTTVFSGQRAWCGGSTATGAFRSPACAR